MKILLFMFVVFYATKANQIVSSTIGCDYPFVSVLLNCYYFSDATADWYDALGNCHDRGAFLVLLESEEENNAVTNYVSSSGREFWTSGFDAPQDGTFISTNNFDVLQFSDWQDKQPDNKNVENCIKLNSKNSSQWDDEKCTNDALYFICEM